MPKVSAVIPCYNHGQYIDEAVDSILKQTYQDVEIIVINDGSTDRLTIEKLQAYCKPKTRVIHTENRGPSAARNSGIAAAAGEYILLLDADDYFEATFLEKAVPILDKQPEIGAVSCGVQQFGASRKRDIPRGGDAKNFVVRNSAVGNGLIRKACWEQIGGYDERMKDVGYEDWNFWLDLTKRGWLVHIIPEYLFYYRHHPVSRRTRSHGKRLEVFGQIIRNHRDLFERYVEEIVLEKELKIYHLRREKQRLLDSWEYRVGSLLLWPLRMLERLAKTLKKRLLP